jgi:N-acetylglucosaminyldiphosphoundecaprenol N-acetyl-beta-D-mannosaminyltransferase
MFGSVIRVMMKNELTKSKQNGSLSVISHSDADVSRFGMVVAQPIHVKQLSSYFDGNFGNSPAVCINPDPVYKSSSIVSTVTVGDVPFSRVTMQEATALILLMIQKSHAPHHIVTGNLDHLFRLQSDIEFKKAYETASLVLADGMPIVWLSKILRLIGSDDLSERVAGSDLFWELGRISQSHGVRIFLLGGVEGAADGAKKALEKVYPGCEVCGTYCPPFETFNTQEEQNEILRRVRAASPDVLLVAFGAPKQEKWIQANNHRLGVPVSIGVGGSFEMACGISPRAPKIYQQLGLEWAFRLVQDPARLYDRYVRHDLPFLVRLLIKTVSDVATGDRLNTERNRHAFRLGGLK